MSASLIGDLLVVAIAVWGAGVVLALVMPSPRTVIWASSLAAALGALATLVTGLTLLTGAQAPRLTVPSPLPFGPLVLHPDALSAFFLVVIGLVGAPVALYSVGYLSAFAGHRDLRLFGVLLNGLLLTLVLIVAAADAVLFLLAWQTMAWLSYLLVNYEHEDPTVIRAGYRMLVVGELGTIGVVSAFLLLFGPIGRLDFAGLREGAAALSPALRNVAFLAALFGFAAKAGILPLQLWLPDAHPAAPSNVSALLSAVVIKLGIYGIARFALDLLSDGPGWWGLVMVELGAITALAGILYALVQIDLKRVLAYSSIENVGFILAGLGTVVLFRALGLPALAAIGGIAALYHVLNHATYKSLLFLAVGAIDRAAGTRALDRLGGLVKRMPWTAALFLVGALAIAGVPPLNGYISEWMTLEVFLRTNAIPSVGTRMAVVVGGVALALTAGLAVTTFVRAFGIACVGLPRTPGAATAQECPRSMRLAMGSLGLACLALGALPTFVLPALDRVMAPLLGTSVINQVVPPVFSDAPGPYAPLAGIGGRLFRSLPVNGLIVIAAPTLNTITAPTYLLLAEALLVVLLLLGLRALRPLGTRRTGPVWAGGIPVFTSRMQYSGLAYANPIRLIFNSLYRSRHRVNALSPAARHGEGRIEYVQEVPELLEREVYQPLQRAVTWIAALAGNLQSGSVNRYVAYIFVIVLVILLLRLF